MRIALVIPVVAAAAVLAGCEATPPSITTGDIADFYETAAAAEALPTTAIGDLPSGTVTYSGQFGSDATVEGNTDYAMIGDMEMRVFFGAQDVDGRIDNINLIQNGIPQQEMDGYLNIDGNAVNGVIVADAEGTLYRVVANKTELAFTELELLGTVQTGLTDGDVISGTVTGGGSGQFTFVLQDGGVFYGTADQ
jgi:hypothetical protein